MRRVLGRGATSEAGLTAQKASFHRHWLPQNPTAHLPGGWGQESPLRMVITKPAVHGLAAEQQWISHHCQCSVCLQPFGVLCLFFIYWVNLACAEVLSWPNWAVKSSIDVRKEQGCWHNAALVPHGQAALGPSEPLHNLGLQCQKKRNIRHFKSCWSQGESSTDGFWEVFLAILTSPMSICNAPYTQTTFTDHLRCWFFFPKPFPKLP